MSHDMNLFVVWALIASAFAYAACGAWKSWIHWRDILALMLALIATLMMVNAMLHACVRLPNSLCEHGELVSFGRVLLGVVAMLSIGAVHEYRASRWGTRSLLDKWRRPLERYFGERDERGANGTSA